MLRKVLAIFIVLMLSVSMVIGLSACNLSITSEAQTFAVEGQLKVGILSDSQLPTDPKDDNGKYKANLIKGLQVLKDNGVNMILFAGDIGDNASKYVYDTYNECINTVFGENKPIFQSILGNHDYWGKLGAAKNYREMFETELNQSPWTHYVVNGYHFIGLSPDCGNMEKGYDDVEGWAKKQIKQAIAEDPSKPVFVMTHNSPKDTVYGSDDWGDKTLHDIFDDYPQVVNISGHLHYSILDERSIFQKDFTAFSTQSVSYTEMEKGKINGSIPPNADITPMGLIMEFNEDKIDILRINFETGLEEKQDMRWSLPTNISKDKFTYTSARTNNNTAPTMPEGQGSSIIDQQITYLKFAAGSDNDFVHSYKVVWSDNSINYYFSDFYNGIANMKKEVQLAVDKKVGLYSAKVYAVDSYGAISDKFIQINNIAVERK